MQTIIFHVSCLDQQVTMQKQQGIVRMDLQSLEVGRAEEQVHASWGRLGVVVVVEVVGGQVLVGVVELPLPCNQNPNH